MSTTLAARAVSGQRHPAGRGSAGWKFVAALAGFALLLYIYYPRDHVVTDPEADFNVRVPRAWKPIGEKQFAWMFQRQTGMEVPAQLLVIFEPRNDVPARPNPRLMRGELLRMLGPRGRNPNIQEEEATTVGGWNAYRLTCTFEEVVGGLPLRSWKIHIVTIARPGKGFYHVGLQTKYDSWSLYKPDYDEVVASFRAPAD